jgi:cell wall-associated NlpC family hydrolase
MKYLKAVIFQVIALIYLTGCTPSERTITHTGEMKYVSAKTYTPVFNIPDIYKFLSELDTDIKTDKKGLIPEVSFIASPGKEFEIIEETKNNGYTIMKVKPVDSEKIYYVDSRFLEQSDGEGSIKEKLSKEEIIRNLKAMEGYPYEYGGAIANGVWKLESMYDIKGLNERWKPKGLDCSGLIYQATNGVIPRSSSEIVKYGEGLDIEGKKLDDIIDMLEPLDIIGYPGHVLIVIDRNSVMESSPKKGVRILQAETRIKQLMKDRKPVNDVEGEDKNKIFVVRRWYK